MDKMTPEEAQNLRRAVQGRSRKTALQRAGEEKLNEAGGGLARIAKHMNRPFAMISAFKQEAGRTHIDNLKATKELVQDMISLRMSGLRMKGNYGSPEISFFVPAPEGMSFEQFLNRMEDLGHKYEQESVGIGDGETFSLHYMNGSVDQIGQVATMRPDAVEDMWSEIKNKKFVITKKEDDRSHIDHTRLK
jgi:hypothetical protein